jgi:hypothetical protein
VDFDHPIETALPFPMVMALQHVLGRYRGQYASHDPHLERPWVRMTAQTTLRILLDDNLIALPAL